MRRFALILTIAAVLLALGSPASAQAGSPIEVTEEGKLIYGGDIVYECASVGSGIVIPAPNSSAQTRSELRRTNEEAIRLCTEAGFPPSSRVNVSEDLAADEEGNLVGPPPPRYEVTENGSLIVGGDVVLGGYCNAFAANPERNLPEEKEYTEACQKAGYEPSYGGGSTLLPETGGARIGTFAIVAAVLAGSVLALAIRR